MSPIVRTIALKRTSRTLLKCLSKKNFGKLIYRTYFLEGSQSSSNNHPVKRTNPFSSSRDLNFALLGGSVLVLTYSYFSSKSVVSLETVKGMRQYSTNGINHVAAGIEASSGNSGSKATSSANSEGSSRSGSSEDSIMILTEQDVNSRLRARQESYFVNRGKGVLRYDVSQLPSNHPIEDNHVEQIVTVPSPEGKNDPGEEDLYFFGIFDGHSGSFTSARLSHDLVQYVAQKLGQVYAEKSDVLSSSQRIDNAIAQAFMQLDNDIVYGSLRNLFQEPTKENMVAALPAISGSCALLSAYNSLNSTLKVAVSGDSRALLGGLDEKGNWVVKSLSTDQTGDNPKEVERIRSEHPGEPNVIRNGRVLGSLQPSRAFGDYRYKLNTVDGKSLSELPEHVKIYFRSKPRDFLTPPYVTAMPEITTTKIEPNTKFMVLASDGLFELLSNEEIAGLVVRWMEYNVVPKPPISAPKWKLPVISDLSSDKESQRPAFRYKSSNKRSSSAEYLLEDKNVATHLIRNALSAGGSKEYVSTLVSIPSPMSRKYRDDLTVTVVFFGESDNAPEHTDGSIVVNNGATSQPKPKL